jgi:hypothetical protein
MLLGRAIGEREMGNAPFGLDGVAGRGVIDVRPQRERGVARGGKALALHQIEMESGNYENS